VHWDHPERAGKPGVFATELHGVHGKTIKNVEQAEELWRGREQRTQNRKTETENKKQKTENKKNRKEEQKESYERHFRKT